MAFEYHDFVEHESSARMRECSIKTKEISQYHKLRISCISISSKDIPLLKKNPCLLISLYLLF